MSVICDRFDTLGQEDPARTYRLGIMGGTFDPIHMGHLVCAEQARDALELDGVIFMPAGNPVFKKHIEVSDAHHRVAMCRAAIEDNPVMRRVLLAWRASSGSIVRVAQACRVRRSRKSSLALVFVRSSSRRRSSSSLRAIFASVCSVTDRCAILSRQQFWSILNLLDFMEIDAWLLLNLFL